MKKSDVEINSRIIGEFMGGKFVDGKGKCEDRIIFDHNWYYMPMNYHVSWDALMTVGQRMDKMIMDGNWGLFEQFFSDEMHAMDGFRKACSVFDIVAAHKHALAFIEALKHQDPKTVKKAKQYNGN